MQKQQSTTTIAALATAPAPAGLAVIRVSGPEARRALRALFRSSKDPVSLPRNLVFGNIIDFHTNEVIDTALAVFMPGPNSYTGEDIAEFQSHGSPALVQKILRSLLAFGAVPAEPGEFTKRAFLNGKIDLIQAEAIADLIAATTEKSLSVANDQLRGKLSGLVDTVAEPLRGLLAELEAHIDFSDEDIEPAKQQHIVSALQQAGHSVTDLLKTFNVGHAVKEGFKVLICGEPNVGKSSLLNLLLGRSRALVSPIAGTTRDLIEEEAQFDGFRFIFCDSAGLRATDDTVEQMGVALTKERLPWADVVLFVVDAQTDATNETWRETLRSIRPHTKKVWLVVNKIDLNPAAFGVFSVEPQLCAQTFFLSAKSGAGVETLTQALVDDLSGGMGRFDDGSAMVSSERQRNCLLIAQKELDMARDLAPNQDPQFELLAHHVRQALQALSEMIGKTYTEDLLGRIFSKFCIGK